MIKDKLEKTSARRLGMCLKVEFHGENKLGHHSVRWTITIEK